MYMVIIIFSIFLKNKCEAGIQIQVVCIRLY